MGAALIMVVSSNVCLLGGKFPLWTDVLLTHKCGRERIGHLHYPIDPPQRGATPFIANNLRLSQLISQLIFSLTLTNCLEITFIKRLSISLQFQCATHM